jgi:hypothetical protein
VSVPGKDANMSEAKRSKTYVRPDNSAVLTCPHCGRQKTIEAERFKGRRAPLKVKCVCTKIFLADIEFRKKIRKRTNLRGSYVNHSKRNNRGLLTVRNVSLSGLEFSSMDHKNFNIGDELTLEFQLDDEHMTEIRKDAVVFEMRDHTIACQFDRGGDFAYEGPLGFYIMS